MKFPYASKRGRNDSKNYKRRVVSYRTDPHPPRSRIAVNSKELKYADYNTTGIACRKDPGAGEVVYNNPVQQGSGVYARIGQRYRPLALHIRGTITVNLSATQLLDDIVGYYVVHDKAPNGVIATISQIFNNSSNDMIRAFPDQSFSVLGNRFTIIKRFTCTINPTLAESEGVNVKAIDHYIKIPKSCGTTNYTLASTFGTMADCVNGAIYVIPFGTQSSNYPSMNYSSRLYFEDV